MIDSYFEERKKAGFAVPLPREKWLNRFPVVLAANNNYTPFVTTTLYSVLKNTESYVDFFILEDGKITSKNKKKISQSLKIFNNYSITYINASKHISGQFPDVDTRSKMAFARYFIGDILPGYEKILYLDCDIIFCGDIIELFNLDMDNFPIVALWEDFVEYTNIKKNLYPEYKGGYFSFNSGVLLINLRKFRKYTKYFVELTLKFQNLLKYSDQDVLNIVFDNNFKHLDFKYNFQIGNFYHFKEAYPKEASEIMKNPFLIHWSGMEIKPWKCKILYGYLFWEIAKRTKFYKEIKNIRLKYKNKIISKTGFYLLNLFPIIEKARGEDYISYRILGITIFKIRHNDFIWSDFYGYSDENKYGDLLI